MLEVLLRAVGESHAPNVWPRIDGAVRGHTRSARGGSLLAAVTPHRYLTFVVCGRVYVRLALLAAAAGLLLAAALLLAAGLLRRHVISFAYDRDRSRGWWRSRVVTATDHRLRRLLRDPPQPTQPRRSLLGAGLELRRTLALERLRDMLRAFLERTPVDICVFSFHTWAAVRLPSGFLLPPPDRRGRFATPTGAAWPYRAVGARGPG